MMMWCLGPNIISKEIEKIKSILIIYYIHNSNFSSIFYCFKMIDAETMTNCLNSTYLRPSNTIRNIDTVDR